MFTKMINFLPVLVLAVQAASIKQMSDSQISQQSENNLLAQTSAEATNCYCQPEDYCFRNTGCIQTLWDQQIQEKHGDFGEIFCTDVGDFRCPNCQGNPGNESKPIQIIVEEDKWEALEDIANKWCFKTLICKTALNPTTPLRPSVSAISLWLNFESIHFLKPFDEEYGYTFSDVEWNNFEDDLEAYKVGGIPILRGLTSDPDWLEWEQLEVLP